MSLEIQLSPSEEVKFREYARKSGVDPLVLARHLLTAPLVAQESVGPAIDDETSAAISQLDAWLATEGTDDPETIKQAERDLAEFKRNINANREAQGDPPVYS